MTIRDNKEDKRGPVKGTLKCVKCGYEWSTRANLSTTICPNCQQRVKNVHSDYWKKKAASQ